MSKTYHKQPNKWDDYVDPSWQALMDSKLHREEKRLKAALRRKSVRDLFDDDRDDDT